MEFMARRLGKRKSPSRDKYMLKEQRKVDSGIFDERTMKYLSKFYNKGVVEKLESIIARGKEADIYLAVPGNSDLVKDIGMLVLKFFRIETTSFFTMADYITGDPRFSKKISRNKKVGIAQVWCQKEFGNLEIAAKAGVNAPKPIMSHGSILAMELIEEDGAPAPQLRDVDVYDPDRMLADILDNIRKLYLRELVHADVSEYNILVKDEGRIPYFIDFGQAVTLEHPNASTFLKRDIRNIVSYFAKRYKTKMSYEEAIKTVIS